MAVPVSPYRVKEKSGWAIADPSCIRRRVLVCLAVLCFAFAGLLVRLWYLQVVRGAAFLVQAQNNRLENVPLSAPRGLILDRTNKILATSRATHSVAVVPAALPSARRDPVGRQRVLSTLGFIIHVTPQEIEKQLEEARRRGGRLYDPVRVGGPLDLKTITLVEENKARLGPTGAVLVTNDIKRFYPSGATGAHVLGYSGVVTAEDIEKSELAMAEGQDVRPLSYDDIVGKIGIEREYDRVLAGARGSEQYEVDARGRPVRRRGEIKEKPGQTLVLTIDEKLQRAAEAALDKARNSGAIAAVDPRNGEVLALASRPTFDPNVFSLPKKAFQPRWQAYNSNKKHPLINRAVTSRFPPGSTFKMIVAAAGLQQGSLTPAMQHTCTGSFFMGRRFGCWKTHGAGIDLDEALAQSCDVYFYQQALRMGNPESSGPAYLAKITRQFGLGQRTQIDLPIDAKGLVPDPAWRRRINARNPDLARWYPGNTLNMSIGQGDVLATPLQMALATAAFGNGGTLWQPHLMKEVRDAATNRVLKRAQPKGHSVGIDQKYLSVIAKGMRSVVTHGTGRGAFADMKQVAVAGKTGSAEDDANGTAHAWWVCFAPYDPTGRVKPKIAIAVIIENSGHGSENAAPVAKKVLDAMFPAPKQLASRED
ncbi:MAG TPA: penicillin-binding protein 2 [Abditibacteriaceae bacterium]|jgi:penicillin-binding protein 2